MLSALSQINQRGAMTNKCQHVRDGSEVVTLPDGTHMAVVCPGRRVECFARALWRSWYRTAKGRR
jgi:hypothetical protein